MAYARAGTYAEVAITGTLKLTISDEHSGQAYGRLVSLIDSGLVRQITWQNATLDPANQTLVVTGIDESVMPKEPVELVLSPATTAAHRVANTALMLNMLGFGTVDELVGLMLAKPALPRHEFAIAVLA
jgi:hypothetical protein